MEFNLYTISLKGFLSRTYEIRYADEIIYRAKRSFFYKSVTLYDMEGEEIFKIVRNNAIFTISFRIIYHGEEYARIKSSGLFSAKLSISTEEDEFYEIKGKPFYRDFTIIKNAIEIAKVSRKPLAFRNRFGIAIQEGEDDELILAFVLVIEMLVHLRRAKSSG